VNESDRSVFLPTVVSEDRGSSAWTPDELLDPADTPTANVGSGFVNLGFLGAAIGRGKRTWLTAAAIGLLLGCGLFATTKSTASASVSILLAEDSQNQLTGISTDTLLAQDPNLAAAVVKKLGLSMSPADFLGTYSATLTNGQSEVLVIKATAASPAQASNQANEIAAEFLTFRAKTLRGQADATDSAENAEITADRQTVADLEKKISTTSAEPSSATQQAQLSDLQSEKRTAQSALSNIERTAGSDQAARQLTVSSEINGTQILYSTPPKASSRKKIAIEYVGGLFFGGLIIGLAIVIIGAVTSNRLRRRDDIAAALGAPVKLSVTSYSGKRRLLPLRARGSVDTDTRRVVGYLKNVLQRTQPRPVPVAIVAVDNLRTVAPLILALAAALGEDRSRVALADLSSGQLARRLGEEEPGVRKTTVGDKEVVLVVPGVGNEFAAGPLGRARTEGTESTAQKGVAAAYSGADYFLTVTDLDPAMGGDHLATWAKEAIVVLTAGQASAVKIQSVGEMIQAAGLHITSAILLGADKDDETLGHLPLA
jgi:capsular polysaccharide biosynthesis protein